MIYLLFIHKLGDIIFQEYTKKMAYKLIALLVREEEIKSGKYIHVTN
jgi:hypothetical protein